MKRVWFFSIVFVVIIAAVAGWAEYQNRQKQIASRALLPTPTPENVAPLPNVQNFPNVPPGAAFVYVGPQKPIPESFPTYHIGPDMTIPNLTQLAIRASRQLGLTTTSSAAIIKGSFVFVLNQDPLSFYLTRNSAGTSISYQRRLPQGANSSSLPPDGIAKDFLAQLNVVPPPYVLSSLGQQDNAGESIGIADIPQPQLFKYGFGITINGVPVLTSVYTAQWGTVVVDQGGIVRLAKITLPYPTPSPSDMTKLVSIESALSALAAGRGVLVGVFSEGQDYFDAVAPAFAKGMVSDYTVVYVGVGGDLVPAYRLVGSGQAQNGTTQSFEALVLASAQ